MAKLNIFIANQNSTDLKKLKEICMWYGQLNKLLFP